MKRLNYFLLLIALGLLRCGSFNLNTDKAPDWTRNASIYEVNLRQYSDSGSFQAFAEQLPRLKEMGVDILWFMPIQPIGEVNRKGALGSYYSIRDYTAVNSEHGTLEDFKALVNQIHEQGMYVILDWVANHTAWDHVWTQTHQNWYTLDSLKQFVPPVADWSDVIDLNYENAAMRQAMIDAMAFWLEETDIDGFRCDVAEMVPLDFWLEARRQLDTVKPGFWLAEGAVPELHQAFHATYNWELFHKMNAAARGKSTVHELDSLVTDDLSRFPAGAYRMLFTSNHDENSWNGTVYERLGEGAEAFAILTVALPGMPLVYSGQEAGLDKRLNFFEKDVIDWQSLSKESFYRSLLTLKEKQSCLGNGTAKGSYQRIAVSDERVYAFLRKDARSEVLVIVNLSGQRVRINFNEGQLIGEYHSLFENEKVNLFFELSLSLNPWGYEVYYK